MLGQRRRRWPSVETTLCYRLVFAGIMGEIRTAAIWLAASLKIWNFAADWRCRLSLWKILLYSSYNFALSWILVLAWYCCLYWTRIWRGSNNLCICLGFIDRLHVNFDIMFILFIYLSLHFECGSNRSYSSFVIIPWISKVWVTANLCTLEDIGRSGTRTRYPRGSESITLSMSSPGATFMYGAVQVYSSYYYFV